MNWTKNKTKSASCRAPSLRASRWTRCHGCTAFAKATDVLRERKGCRCVRGSIEALGMEISDFANKGNTASANASECSIWLPAKLGCAVSTDHAAESVTATFIRNLGTGLQISLRYGVFNKRQGRAMLLPGCPEIILESSNGQTLKKTAHPQMK